MKEGCGLTHTSFFLLKRHNMNTITILWLITNF